LKRFLGGSPSPGSSEKGKEYLLFERGSPDFLNPNDRAELRRMPSIPGAV
jgi:hypothetical protein